MNPDKYSYNQMIIRNIIFLILYLSLLCFLLPASVSAPDGHGGTEYWVKYQNRNRAGYPGEAGGMMPPYIWAAGCTPTAAAMVLGYWDNYASYDNTAYGGSSGTGKFTTWGRLIRYYVDTGVIENTTVPYFGGNYHAQSNHEYSPDILIDAAVAMYTRDDGLTYHSQIKSGINFVTSGRGYGSWANYHSSGTWSKIKEQINAGRPCMWNMKFHDSVHGHSVAAWGYVEGGTYDRYVTIYNTWDEMKRQWPLSSDTISSRAVMSLIPQQGIQNQDIAYLSPQKGAFFNHESMTIRWYQYGNDIDRAWILYSTDGGYHWYTIANYVASSQGTNNYSWDIPDTIDSNRVKIRIMAYDSSQAGPVAQDGNKKNLTVKPLNCIVLRPDTPFGSTNLMTNWNYTYSTDGASCTEGHSVEYRFDWDDGSFSQWSSSTTASHSWSSPGNYYIRAQARCSFDNSVESIWSPVPLSVRVEQVCIVYTPERPSGPATGNINTSYNYYTRGSSCLGGHPVEYRFSWGDGSWSDWSDSIEASHSWSSEGTYHVRAYARCAETQETSPQSESFQVSIFAPYNALIMDSNLPFTLSPGQKFQFELTIYNAGFETWSFLDKVMLGALKEPDFFAPPEYHRVELTHDVAPEQTYTFSIPVQAPMERGSYVTEWQMTQAEQLWFGETFSQVVEVEVIERTMIQSQYWHFFE